MKKNLIFIWILSLNTFLFTSPPDTIWTKVYGTMQNEYGRSILETDDGGYIIASYWRGYIYLLKTDENGDSVWLRGYDGGKVSMVGDMMLQKTFDGGYVIGGTKNADFYLIKVDAIGNPLWGKTINVGGDDSCYSILRTPDSGFVLTGFGSKIVMVKVNSNGDVVWIKTYKGGNCYYYSYSIIQTIDGFLIVGRKDSLGGYYKDLFLLKINFSGDSVWFKNLRQFSASLSAPDAGHSIYPTSDGGCVITGYQYSYGRGNDVCLVKIDQFGNVLWNKKFGGPGDDRGYAVRETSDGGYIIVGKKQVFFGKGNDIWIIKTNSFGDTLWTKTVGGSGEEAGYSIQETSDGNYIISGYTTSYGAGGADLYLIKLSGSTKEKEKKSKRIFKGIVFKTNIFKDKVYLNFPNSFKNSKFTLKIYDVSGLCKYKKDILLTSTKIILEDKELKRILKGLYFMEIFQGNKRIARIKFIKI